ncbi:MAG: hypothetical protein ABEI86_02195 [Halobacteriaceae archaeon]
MSIHFQRLDSIQHVYHQDLGKLDPVYEEYEKIDNIAKNIKSQALTEGYDNILFLSEHGLPTPDQGTGYHKPKGFYSCNQTIDVEDPSILDFYDLLVRLSD